MIPVPPVLIVVVVVVVVLRNDVRLETNDATPHQAAQIVVDLVVAHTRNGKMTTLKFRRRRTVYRRSGIIVQRMNQIRTVTRMGIDVIGGGPDRVAVGDIDRHRDVAHHEIVHQGSKEIGKGF